MGDLARSPGESIRPLRRAEYDQLVALGVFDDERLELLNGMLVTMSPQRSPHAAAISLLTQLLVPLLGTGKNVPLLRVQCPLAVSETSEPEPDLAVVAPSEDSYASEHPRTALWVIEVAESSLDKDRTVKAPLYAHAGVPEYWIVNLVDQVVEAYRNPGESGYGQMTSHGRDEVLQVQTLPELEFCVADFLPAI